MSINCTPSGPAGTHATVAEAARELRAMHTRFNGTEASP